MIKNPKKDRRLTESTRSLGHAVSQNRNQNASIPPLFCWHAWSGGQSEHGQQALFVKFKLSGKCSWRFVVDYPEQDLEEMV